MQRIIAIALLTWKAAFRFRLFLVLAVLLLASVIVLPVLIKDDGTARGFTQILLAYTLTTITALLGLSTLWLACGTLARDIEECQIQVVAVKPVARWQIWFGKWLGIVSLNASLLALAGVCVFALLQWRATRLPPDQQAILKNEILVARSSRTQKPDPAEIQAEVESRMKERLTKSPVSAADLPEVHRQIEELVKAEIQVVPPDFMRKWEINFGLAKHSLAGRPLYLRTKFNAAEKSPTGAFGGVWYIGVPQKTKLWRSDVLSMAPDTYHELEIPPDLLDENGLLTVTFRNINNTALLFPLEDGFEVLYREGGFALNFARGLGVIFCWMCLLTTLGLTASTFLSFPVAAFFSIGLLGVTLSTGTLTTAITEGTVAGWNAEKGTRGHSVLDPVVIPTFRAVLGVINLAKDFSPVDSLATGRSITWGQLGLAFAQIVGLLGGIIGVFGVVIFSRRELATAQGNQ